jgi:magnesium transporter
MGVRWIDLLDPSEEEIRQALPEGLHERALEQLLQHARHDDEPRPRLEGHDTYVFGVFLIPICIREEDRVFYQEVDLVATHDRLVIVRKTPDRGWPAGGDVAREAAAGLGDAPPGKLVYVIVDLIAEYYLDLVDALNDEIDELEEGIEAWGAAQIRDRISRLRHDLLHVRRSLAPTRDAIHAVVDRRIDVRDGPELFPPEVELDFSAVYDKLLRASDGLELSRDLLGSVRDFHQSKIANDQNEVMKRLTVIASLLLLPTFIVGLYGQNFRRIPELHWGFGYWWSWGWIVATTILQLIMFRWMGWIGGEPLGRPKLPPLGRLDPRTLRGRRQRPEEQH